MIKENLSTLKIHNLSQEQYDRELEAGRIDENAMYFTPEEELTPGKIGAATQEELQSHIDDTNNPHNVTPEQIGALTAANFEYKNGILTITTV